MTREWEDHSSSPEEMRALAQIADRLELERPVPAPGFRGELRRSLIKGSRRRPAAPLRVWVASYLGAGTLCLLVAAAGLLGAGPFAT
jgi:hypothetical protein